MIARFFAFAAVALLLSSCQIKPTTGSNSTTPGASVGEQEVRALILAQNPVILDTRSPLDFGVSHVPGAINVAWTDFTLPGAKQKGLLDPDHFALARRLALWGIDPDRPVLVIGDEKDRADAGWVGWMLHVLGVKVVNTGSPKQYRSQIPRPESPPENKPMWKPSVRDELIAAPAEGRQFLKGPATTAKLMTKARGKALQGARLPPELGRKKVVIDVRSEAQRKALPLELFGWKGPVVLLPWDKVWQPGVIFMNEIESFIKDGALSRDNEILVVSENGLEGGAVAFALDAVGPGGFKFVRNLDAGLRGVGTGK